MSLTKISLPIIGGLLFVLTHGCASFVKKHKAIDIPPGLDSTTTVHSYQLANRNFVSGDREKDAKVFTEQGAENLRKVDEFWDYLEQNVQKDEVLTDADKSRFDREMKRGADALTIGKQFAESTGGSSRQAALHNCLEAQRYFEQALRIDPFDKNTRMLLSVTYYYLQRFFGESGNAEKAIYILERLVRIEKGEHELFRLLADNYAVIKNYDNALDNYRKGLAVLRMTNFETQPDSSLLFAYNYAMADIHARKHDAMGAITKFKIANEYATTQQEKADVAGYLDWINWDNGNIRSSETWDEILKLETTSDYSNMARVCRKLIPNLTNPQAKMAALHKLALVEFEFLNKKVDAIEWMRALFHLLPAQQVKFPTQEVQQYLNTYGAMLYRIGNDHRRRGSKRIALAYFQKASSFQWDEVAKVYFELMTLLWNDPRRAIIYGQKALDNYAVFTPGQSCEIISLMSQAHKSAGHYDKARVYFNKWKECKESRYD